MAENLYGKKVIYTDAEGQEWPAKIVGPLKRNERGIVVGTNEKGETVFRKNFGGKITPVANPIVEEDVREVLTENPRTPKLLIRTVNLEVDWGHQQTEVTGVKRATSLDGTRKSWRPAPEAPKAESTDDGDSKKTGGKK